MPYITEERRPAINKHIDKAEITSCGELNYAISRLVHNYIREWVSYAAINQVIGVLTCVTLELYRMIGAKYEDTKRMENGPVSELDDDRMRKIK